MGLRKSKYLIRTLLVIICFQFTAASVVSVEMDKVSARSSFAAQKLAKPITISSLFEKTEGENEENEKLVTAEHSNYNFFFLQHLSPLQGISRREILSVQIQQPSLYGLYCNYRI